MVFTSLPSSVSSDSYPVYFALCQFFVVGGAVFKAQELRENLLELRPKIRYLPHLGPFSLSAILLTDISFFYRLFLNESINVLGHPGISISLYCKPGIFL
jgi:hypothetical protein